MPVIWIEVQEIYPDFSFREKEPDYPHHGATSAEVTDAELEMLRAWRWLNQQACSLLERLWKGGS